MKIRKWMLMALALVLALSAGGALGEAAPAYGFESPEGEWVMAYMEMGGARMTPEQMGVSATLQLRADGSCTLSADQDVMTGVWDWDGYEGAVTIDGESERIALENGQLKMGDDEVGIITFDRANAAPATAAPVTATSAGPEGRWNMLSMSLGGTTMTPEDLMGGSVVLEMSAGGSCSMTMSALGQSQTMTGSWTFDGAGGVITLDGSSEDFTLDGDRLVISGEGEEMVFERDGAVQAPAPTAGGADSPEGTWEIVEAYSNGEPVSLEETGMGTLTLGAGGSATVVGAFGTMTGSWTWDGSAGVITFNDFPVPFEITDGQLVLADGIDEARFGRVGGGAAPVTTAADDAPVGTWVLAEMRLDGVPMDDADPGWTTMQINADGTCALVDSSGIGAFSGTWSWDGESGTITIDGESESFDMPDGRLRIFDAHTEAFLDRADAPQSTASQGPEGEWEMVSAVFNDEPADLEAMGIDAQLVMSADGSCEMTNMGLARQGSWTWDGAAGAITIDGETQAFTLEGGQLSIHDDHNDVRFERVGGAAAPAASADSPVGRWTASDDQGSYEMEVLADGSFSLTMKNGEDIMTMAGTWQFEGGEGTMDANGVTETFNMVDGHLRLYNDYMDLLFTRTDGAVGPAAVAQVDLTGGTSANTPAGSWSVVTMSQGDEVIDVKTLGGSMIIVLNADGSASMSSDAYGVTQQIEDGSWTFDGSGGVITFEDDPAHYTFDGEQLILDEGGIQMIFERQ